MEPSVSKVLESQEQVNALVARQMSLTNNMVLFLAVMLVVVLVVLTLELVKHDRRIKSLEARLAEFGSRSSGSARAE